ncbi:site-specific recombinase, phage integrase family [Klebsiella pneumoniae]|nr:site-specific recombinase, phage integrase family [Klebsiella pneumoniae]
MRNWLKQAVKRAEADGVHFSIAVTPHTFRHSYIMHMLYHRQLRKVILALAGHKDPRSTWLPPWPFPLPLTVEMPRRSFAPCHRPAEIVGQAAGALPLSEGDKDKRIPDEAESVSRF